MTAVLRTASTGWMVTVNRATRTVGADIPADLLQSLSAATGAALALVAFGGRDWLTVAEGRHDLGGR